MRGAAQAELDGAQEAAVELVLAVDLRPLVLVVDLDVLRAEDPVQPMPGDRAGVGVAELEVGCAAAAVELPGGPAAHVQLHHVLGRRGAHAARAAKLGGEAQRVAGVELAFQVDELGLGLRARARNHVVQAVVAALVGEAGRHQGVVAHHVAGVGCRAGALVEEEGRVRQVVAVVVAGVERRREAGQRDRDVAIGPQLQFHQATLALALLLKQSRADVARVVDAGQVGVAQRHGAAGLDLVVAQHLDAVAAQVALLGEHLGQHAEGFVA